MIKNLQQHGTVFNMADDGSDLLDANLGENINVNEGLGPSSDKTFEDEE